MVHPAPAERSCCVVAALKHAALACAPQTQPWSQRLLQSWQPARRRSQVTDCGTRTHCLPTCIHGQFINNDAALTHGLHHHASLNPSWLCTGIFDEAWEVAHALLYCLANHSSVWPQSPYSGRVASASLMAFV